MRYLASAALAVLFAFPAYAQEQPCAMRDKVLEHLASAYGETRQGIGLAADGTVVETYANIDTGTWTIAVTRPDGVMCFVAAGEGYERINEAPGKDL